jgi:DNA polymerase-3 subunit epsilon
LDVGEVELSVAASAPADRSVPPLSQVEVLMLDCQATAAAPHGHLLEIGWARSPGTVADIRTHLVALPIGASIPPAVARITGISEPMVRDGVDPDLAWRELAEDVARIAAQPAPTVIHYAQFERPFLRALACGEPPLDIVCAHEIACRLFPDLPRRSLRALVGYLGGGLGVLRRSAEHVEATAFLWQRLVQRLEDEGVSTWTALRAWLATPVTSPRPLRRMWPMPREARLALPKSPGVYRMLRTGGDIRDVGKAASLHHRVNSYFRKQHGSDERMLEMLTQARAISFEVTATPLEAALREPDEIKRCLPLYNLALTVADRAVWFASPNLSERSPRPSASCPLGPFLSADTLDQFSALARGDHAALASDRWGPGPATFDAGYERLCATHPELTRIDLNPPARLLRLGTRLWRQGRRDRDPEDDQEATDSARRVTAWTPELVHVQLERLALRAALVRRRAMWLTRLVDASVVWREPGASGARLLVIEGGEIALSADADPDAPPPIPPGYGRPVIARCELFTVASFDRLRVLTTELKRLVATGAPVAVRFGPAPALVNARLATALWWV